MTIRSHSFSSAHADVSRTGRSLPGLAGICAIAALSTAIDFAAAAVYWSQFGVSPAQVLRSIASWVLGPRPPLTPTVIVVGLCVHFLIYLAMASVLARLLADRRFPPGPGWMTGSLYGVVAYVVVYELLVPIMVLPATLDRSMPWVATCLVVHGLVIGPLMACTLGARRARAG